MFEWIPLERGQNEEVQWMSQWREESLTAKCVKTVQFGLRETANMMKI